MAKIIIAGDSLQPYTCGVSVVVDAYLEALEGHEVTIVAPHHSDVNEYYKNVKVIRLPSIWLNRKRGYRAVVYLTRPYRKKLISDLRASDVLVLHSITPLTVLLLLLVRTHRIKIRIVLHLHTQYDEYAKSWFAPCKHLAAATIVQIMKSMAALSDKVICTSEHYREILYKRYQLKKEAFIWEAPVGLPKPSGGIDIGKIFGSQVRPGSKFLIFCGRVADEKNLGHLFEVFRAVYANDPTVYLVIVGGGATGKYSRIAREICGGASRNIIFTGNLEREQMARLYHQLDQLGTVMGVSSVPNETQGLGVLELMNYGFAVCVLQDTCLAVVVLASGGGFVIANDPLAWSGAIREALGNPVQLKVLGRKGQKYVHARFSRKASYRRLRKLLFE